MTTALKLSVPQTQALHEIYAKAEVSTLTSRKNTIQSLEKLGLIEEGEYLGRPAYFLTDAGKEAIGIVTYDEVIPGPDNVTTIEEELNTNMWDAPVTTEEEIVDFKAMAEKLSGVEDVLGETFDWQLGMYSNTLRGFGDVYKWDNNRVWDGLTAQEIREDMDTAIPIGRKARRERARLARKILAVV